MTKKESQTQLVHLYYELLDNGKEEYKEALLWQIRRNDRGFYIPYDLIIRAAAIIAGTFVGIVIAAIL